MIMNTDSNKKYLLYIITISILFSGIAISNGEECRSCHDIRHGSIDNSCGNCHYNTTVSMGKHTGQPSITGYMHNGFDWEGDDLNESGKDPLDEGCPVCHVSMLEHNAQVFNLCEDCHVKRNPQISKLAQVRQNLTEHIPQVYSHFNGSAIDIPDQSYIGNTRSSCFGLDTMTGESSCHGVPYKDQITSGGLFAIDVNSTGELNNGDPYHLTVPVDFMPDSKDCAFCHLQEDAAIRKEWGNPGPLPSDPSHIEKKNNDCRDCHVMGELKSFHGKEIIKVREKSYTIYIILASGLILVVALVYLWNRKRSR